MTHATNRITVILSEIGSEAANVSNAIHNVNCRLTCLERDSVGTEGAFLSPDDLKGIQDSLLFAKKALSKISF